MTDRVQLLIADAITAMAQDLYGVALAPRDADLMARGGSIRLAHEALSARLSVRRAVAGRAGNDSDFQRRLAIDEVAAELSGAFDGIDRRSLIERLIEREAAMRAQAEAAETAVRDVGAMLEDLASTEPAFRAFARAASRLYDEQCQALTAGIGDHSRLNLAIERLDAAYARQISHVSKLGTRDVGGRSL